MRSEFKIAIAVLAVVGATATIFFLQKAKEPMASLPFDRQQVEKNEGISLAGDQSEPQTPPSAQRKPAEPQARPQQRPPSAHSPAQGQSKNGSWRPPAQAPNPGARAIERSTSNEQADRNDSTTTLPPSSASRGPDSASPPSEPAPYVAPAPQPALTHSREIGLPPATTDGAASVGSPPARRPDSDASSPSGADPDPSKIGPIHVPPKPPEKRADPSDGGSPPPAMSGSTGGAKHKVAAGETLIGIARQHYGDGELWRAIKEANPGLDEKRLLVDKEIVIPPKPAAPPAARATAQKPAPAEPPAARPEGAGKATYVIASGDTLISIARNVLKDPERWREIYDLNKDRVPSPDVLWVGVELRLPPLKTAAKP